MKKYNKIIIIIALVVIVVIVYYFNGRNSAIKGLCESSVSYIPKTESVESNGLLGSRQGVDEHYFYDSRKFKTKDEAVKRCLDKFSSFK